MPNVGTLRLDEFARRRDRVVARLRVARAVGQENAIGIECEHLGGGRLRGDHRDRAAAVDEHAQDVALHAEIVGDNAIPAAARRERRPIEVVTALVELVAFARADDLGEIHARKPGECARLGERVHVGRVRARDDAAALRTLVAQQAREATRVDVGDRDDALPAQVAAQRFLHAPVAR